MSYHPQAWQQDRWQQPTAGSDYATMGGMVYDPPTLPSTSTMQRTTMAPQYSLPATYAESPVTPLSSSSYGSQGHFGEYQPYSYHTSSSAPTPYADQMPLRQSQRPIAPPTPPLEDDHGMRYHSDRKLQPVKSTIRRSPRRSVSVVKSEASIDTTGEIKTCRKYVKEDGRTLQHVSDKNVDKLLQTLEGLQTMLPIRTKDTPAATPESIASPPTEEGHGRPQVKKDKQCPYCHSKFSQSAQLKTHIRAHTGEKPHSCWICGKHVSQLGNLKAHIRKHTNEKPYECSICHLRFASNGGMKVHVKNKHLGETKHICPIPRCEKTFTTIGNMKVHINRFHEPELLQYMDMIKEHDKSKPFPDDVSELWGKLLRIYKNSNCGIKGRGVDDEVTKARDKQFKEQMKACKEQATPVSPVASPATHEYRNYYDHQDHHYAVRSHAAQQTQQPSGYIQQLPLHQSQPIFHGLPQPTPYNMAWAPGQYH
ncbi:unnamed protein product [Discula destructiva]